MTANSPQPMVFGDIHELLRKVNGESEPAYMWQSDENKDGIRQEEPSESPEGPSKDTAKKVKPYSKSQPRKSKSPPQPTKPVGDKEKTVEKTGAKKLSVKSSVPPFKDDLQSAIETFCYGNESGHRHMVFLPDDVYATLETVYGSNRISAILTALARTYIERNKEELRQLIATRTNLLQ